MKWRTYEIHFDGYPPLVRTGTSAAKARYDCFLDLSDAWSDLRFGDFLRRSRVRVCPTPENDGYGYIRRAYGVDVRPGDRVTITREGPDLEGKGATVVYPGQSTAYVKLVIDGEKRISNVHPLSVIVPGERAAA
jgi:hypothetical protein